MSKKKRKETKRNKQFNERTDHSRQFLNKNKKGSISTKNKKIINKLLPAPVQTLLLF
jgi:hypothetical protein